jgi:hypothetical protein
VFWSHISEKWSGKRQVLLELQEKKMMPARQEALLRCRHSPKPEA